jgi:protein TonB
MKPDLWKAAAFAVAVHAALLYPTWSSQPAMVDVERSLVSLEVELFSAAQLPTPQVFEQVVVPQDEAWQHEPAKPPHRPAPSPELVEGHGAVTEAKPQGLRNRPPAYPWLARLQGWEGTVIVQVRIEADGRASQVTVVSYSGHPALDRAAQQAVSQWEFLPAQRGGRPVGSMIRVPVRFRLTEDAPHEP